MSRNLGFLMKITFFLFRYTDILKQGFKRKYQMYLFSTFTKLFTITLYLLWLPNFLWPSHAWHNALETAVGNENVAVCPVGHRNIEEVCTNIRMFAVRVKR